MFGMAILLIMYLLIGVCDFAQPPVSPAFIDAEERIEQQKEHFTVWWVQGFQLLHADTSKTCVAVASESCAPHRCRGSHNNHSPTGDREDKI